VLESSEKALRLFRKVRLQQAQRRLPIIPLKFVNHPENRHRRLVIQPQSRQITHPQAPIAQPDNKILLREAQGSKAFDADCNQFHICTCARFAENVAVKLVMRTQPPFLWLFVAEILCHIEPLDRPFEGIGSAADHAGERWRQFRAQRHFAVALVHEVKQLGHNFWTAFFREELQWLQSRNVVTDKAKTPGSVEPAIEQVISPGTIVRIKITKTGQALKHRVSSFKAGLDAVAPRNRCSSRRD